MSLFRHAAFVTSVAKFKALPEMGPPEVAFAGRSNAGKSSAINTLVAHTRLAFVSKTPGRTQLINYFRMANGAYLVDLPGYGYAKVPEKVRLEWQDLLEKYLTRRQSLVGLVLIMDSRHPLKDLDKQMIEWFAPSARPIHVLLTKCDKLSRGEAAATLLAVKKAVEPFGGQVTVQLFSSLKKIGMEEVEQVLAPWFGDQSGENLEGDDAEATKEGPPVKGEETGGRTP